LAVEGLIEGTRGVRGVTGSCPRNFVRKILRNLVGQHVKKLPKPSLKLLPKKRKWQINKLVTGWDYRRKKSHSPPRRVGFVGFSMVHWLISFLEPLETGSGTSSEPFSLRVVS